MVQTSMISHSRLKLDDGRMAQLATTVVTLSGCAVVCHESSLNCLSMHACLQMDTQHRVFTSQWTKAVLLR